MIKKIINYIKEKRASARRVKNPSFEGVQILFEFDPIRLSQRLEYGLLKQTKKYKIPSFTLNYRDALNIELGYETKDYLKIAQVADLSASKDSDYFYIIALVNAVILAYNDAVNSEAGENVVKEKEVIAPENEERARMARIEKLRTHEKNLFHLVNDSPFEHEFLLKLELKEALRKIKNLNEINREKNMQMKIQQARQNSR